MFNMRFLDSWTRCKETTDFSVVSPNMSLLPLQHQLQFLLATHEQHAHWCSRHDLRRSLRGNTVRDSCPVNMVARTTHKRSALEIDSKEHGYRTYWQNIQDIIRSMWPYNMFIEMLCPRALFPE